MSNLQSHNDVNVKRDYRSRFYAWIKTLDGITRSERSLLKLLAKRADEDGVSRPRQDWMADELGVSVRTIKRAVAGLLKKGLIESDFRYSKRGYRTSNCYRICWEKSLAKSTPTRCQNEHPPRGQNGPDTYYSEGSDHVGKDGYGYTCNHLSVRADEVEGGEYAGDVLAWDAAWRHWQ